MRSCIFCNHLIYITIFCNLILYSSINFFEILKQSLLKHIKVKFYQVIATQFILSALIYASQIEQPILIFSLESMQKY